jgi:acyl-CoA thioesterase-1
MSHSKKRFSSRMLLALVCGIASLILSSCDVASAYLLYELTDSDGGGGGGGGTSGPQTVLVMGDSISARGTYENTQPWPTILQGMEPEWSIVNRAVPGETSGGGASRISGQLQDVNPDVTVILYGSNDAIQQRQSQFESNLTSMIRACQARGSRVAICTVPPMAGQRVGFFQSTVDQINDTIRAVAPSLGATVIRIDNEFSVGDRSVFPDGLHPTQEGQTVIAMKVSEQI